MKRALARLFVNGGLAWMAACAVLPLAWMLSVSFMQPAAADGLPPALLPQHPTLANYHALFAQTGMARYMFNSLLVATLTTLVSLGFNLTAGYAFAKLRFAGRERIFHALVGALLMPAQVAMMPLFLLLKWMGLVNTYFGVMAPMLVTIFGIFMVRQYARSLPDELLEAARMDGASEGLIFVRIVLPLIRPIIVTLAVFTFLASWNDFMWPLIILTGQEHYTLPVALAVLSREHAQDTGQMMAGAVVTMLPVLVLFVALQRHYIQGLLLGSLKG